MRIVKDHKVEPDLTIGGAEILRQESHDQRPEAVSGNLSKVLSKDKRFRSFNKR